MIDYKEIVRLRKEKGLTNKELGRMTGLTEWVVWKIQTGKYGSMAGPSHLEKLMNALKTQCIGNKYLSMQDRNKSKEKLKMIELTNEELKVYGLKDQPFASGNVGKAVWKNQVVTGLIEKIRQGCLKSSFLLFTGQVGSGKSTILQAVLPELRKKDSQKLKVVFIRPTHVEKITGRYVTDYLIYELTGKTPPARYEKKADVAAEAINGMARAGKRIAVIIDEAQRLDGDALRSIKRYQEGLGTHEGNMAFILIGHIDIMRTLDTDELTEVRKRLIITEIDLFSLNGEKSIEEIKSYLAYKLKQAGCETQLFTDEAVQEIAIRANCVLDINVLATLAIQKAASIGETVITDEIINMVWG